MFSMAGGDYNGYAMSCIRELEKEKLSKQIDAIVDVRRKLLENSDYVDVSENLKVDQEARWSEEERHLTERLADLVKQEQESMSQSVQNGTKPVVSPSKSINSDVNSEADTVPGDVNSERQSQLSRQIHTPSPSTSSSKNGNGVSRPETRTSKRVKNVKKSEPESDGESYEVEKILAFRRSRNRNASNNNRFEYLVKWQGYVSDENTWEPTGNLNNCTEKLDEFQRENEKRMSCLSRFSDEDSSDSSSDERRNKSRRKTRIGGEKRKLQVVSSESEDEKSKRKRCFRNSFSERRKLFLAEMEDLERMELLPMPAKLPVQYASLERRSWISNFTLDDMITSLIECYSLPRDTVTYIPSTYYKFIQLGQGHYQDVCKQLYRQRAVHSNVVLVLTFTGEGVVDDAEHWVLGIIVKSTQTVYLIDSVDDARLRKPIFKNLAVMVSMMFRMEGLSVDLKDWAFTYSSDCKTQANNYDCGVFVALNVYSILQMKLPPKLASSRARQWIYTHLERHAQEVVQVPLYRTCNVTDRIVGQAVKEAFEVRQNFDVPIGVEKTTKKMKNLLLESQFVDSS
ncbi:hypothetical protein HDE_08654 [Halotydeus destructor]|nr:hypothetical protein HDE_08654 [Halotydeus destructor]